MTLLPFSCAQVAELVDAQVSGTCGATRVSSSLILGTILKKLRIGPIHWAFCRTGIIERMSIHLHQGDLPANVSFGDSVAVDSEALGLSPKRDRLCLVQLSAGDGAVHLVQFDGKDYSAPNLKKLLTDKKVTKIFHFARFDVGLFYAYLGVLTAPIYCTKLASRLARTFTQHHSLKTLCRDLLGVDMDKQQQASDWGAEKLTPEQIEYAASDVLYLHRLRESLDEILAREGRNGLAAACFDFLPHRALLDIAGWAEEDIFEH